MARLILLNGPPSSGKSTLARRFVDDHPLALCLDIDVVRAMLGRWLDRPTEAGLIAREMAKGMAAVQLEGDRDVIVPQYVGRLPFVEQLDALAVRTGAAFVEVALLPSKAAAVAWFARRVTGP